MTIKHTPGPWREGRVGDDVVSGDPIDDGPNGDFVHYHGGHLIAESIAPCNKSLIIAAPELLGDLVALVNLLPEPEIELAREVWGNTNTRLILEARKKALETIAKATETQNGPLTGK